MKPERKHQLQAIAALACAAILLILVVVFLLAKPAALVLGVVGLALVGAGGWWTITEQAPRRIFGLVGLALGLIAILIAIVGVLASSTSRALVFVAVLVLAALAAGQARLALVSDLHVSDAESAPTPKKPVLIANLKSGGGKVEKFGLVPLAESHGVEVIILNQGDDLEQLARDAIAAGADCIGMAGGDGSQALVASVAVELDIPFVCISAGTRNHFALDLGLNREDPREGMIAFKDALERRIDYATVGDRLFVNNVSMGVYATIVQEDSYRDAKLETSKELLPELLGQQEKPFDLQFTTPAGEDVNGAFVILVSNNPYVLGPKIDVSQRRSLTTGKLGVFAVNASTGAEAAKLVARSTLGLGARDPNIHEFEAETFEVRSQSGQVYTGVDGEALTLPTPLEFRIHPAGLRIRVPSDSQDRVVKRAARNVSIGQLIRIAQGKPVTITT